jgi:hypothetical protein
LILLINVYTISILAIFFFYKYQHSSYLNLHTFGYVCFVHLPSHERNKLSAQSVKCAFIGYSISHKCYVCYDSCVNKYRISRNVVFFENQYFFPTYVESLPEISLLPCFDDLSPLPNRFKPELVYARHQPTLPRLEYDPSSETILKTSPKIDMTTETGPISSPMPPEPSPRQSIRISRPPERYGDYDTSFNITLSSVSIPTCFLEAVKYECRRKAMDEELQAH